jgi:archaetidylinositol phosphate synthase
LKIHPSTKNVQQKSKKGFSTATTLICNNTAQLRVQLLTKLKKQIQQMLTSQANAAQKIGLTPNKISIIGFILALTSAASYALTTSNMPWLLILAVILLMASGFCDTLDGIVARTFQQTTVFGGFLDSVLDRYADAAVYAAIIIAGLSNAAWGTVWGVVWGLAALSGSIMVSYTRARAEAAGIKMESVGLAERAERMLILAVVSIIAFFWLPAMGYGIAVLAVLSNFTVIQRAWHVYKTLKVKN